MADEERTSTSASPDRPPTAPAANLPDASVPASSNPSPPPADAPPMPNIGDLDLDLDPLDPDTPDPNAARLSHAAKVAADAQQRRSIVAPVDERAVAGRDGDAVQVTGVVDDVAEPGMGGIGTEGVTPMDAGTPAPPDTAKDSNLGGSLMLSTDMENDQSSSTAIQVIDFLDTYQQFCTLRGLFVIESLVLKLQEAIDGGPLPTDFPFSGKHPDIHPNRLDDDYAEIIMTPMAGVTFITNIDFSYNDIADRGARAIASFLREDRYVKRLDLKANLIGREGAVALAKAVGLNECLQYMDMSCNEIGDEGGMEFAASLQINTTLTELHLGSCTMGATALIALATVLQQNNTLHHLTLANNESRHSRLTQSLQSDVMSHISRMLRDNRSLVSLSLSKFGVTDWTMKDCLAEAVRVNCRVRHLDLSCNRITRDGGVALCQALYKQPFISRLNLSCCSIQDEGAEAVSVMLLHNRSLSRLFLDHNAITGKGLRSLAYAIIKNPTLTHLTLWGNLWDVPACDAFSPLVGGPVRSVSAAPSRSTTPAAAAVSSPSPTTSSYTTSDPDLRSVVAPLAPRYAPGVVGAATPPPNVSGVRAGVAAGAANGSGGVRASQAGGNGGLTRFKPENVDVVFYAVGGVLQVARNE